MSWLRHIIAHIPGLPSVSVYPVCEELRQELALYLWERITDFARYDIAWERTYWSALTYAQKHVARSYMTKMGFWVSRTVKQAARGVAVPLLDDNLIATTEAPEVFPTVELAVDMRELVMLLPPQERDAVILRYWQNMREQDIAVSLDCTDRSVRNFLSRAHKRLAIWYGGPGDSVTSAQERASEPAALQSVGVGELE